jgi:uncharacterized repeat protein (TIGR02543 family)
MKVAHGSWLWRLLLVACLLLGGMATSGTPVAAQSGSATSSAIPSNATPSIGQQITVTIRIDVSGVNPPDEKLGSFTGTLQWQPSVLTYHSDSGILAGFTGVVNVDEVASGRITFNGAKPTGATGNITVLTITFNVVGSGTSPLDLGYSAMSSAYTFKSLLSILAVTDGQVQVGAPTQYTLTIGVSPSGGGTTNPAVGQHTYSAGTVVNVTATAAAGYQFASWSGACTGTGTCQVTMDANKTVTANFTPITYKLTVGVSPSGGGTTNPAVGQHTYSAGTVVNVTATAAAGYQFANWSGACSGTGTCQVTMDTNKTVTANFTATTYKLTVGVSPSGGGTTNPAVGQHTYNAGTVVNVTATAAAGYQFANWSGACTGTGTCQVTMNADKTVTANFAPITPTTYKLTVGVSPSGGGTTNPAVGQHTYNAGTVVNVTATAAAGYQFASWSGACSGTGTCQVTMNADKTVTANFTPITYKLTVGVSPSGGGTTNPAVGQHTYSAGTVVNVTATAAAGYQFANWSGACSGTGTCQVTMNADKTVTANFAPITPTTYKLTVGVSPSGGGTTNPAVGQHTYNAGTVVNVTATAAAGYQFANWSGACTGTGTCQVTMNADKTVTANFAPITPTTYNLTVAVDPIGGGTANPSVGVHSYAAGTVVDITATPAAGFAFDSWSGACSGSGTCQVTMDADKTVTAHFVGTTYELTIAVNPAGGGTTDPGEGVHRYAAGTVVNVTATPAAGFAFDYWAGACSGSDECVVTMDENRVVVAHFRPTSHDLTVAVDPVGSGTTNPIEGVHTYAHGTVVNITATPAAGYAFDRWSGACSGSGACQVTMDGDKTVTAHFAIKSYIYYLPVLSVHR